MQKTLKYFILSVVFLVGIRVFAQTFQAPPEPYATAQEPPCSEQAEGGEKPTADNPLPPPPPPGMCMPINEYLIPLFLSGIFLGVYSLRRKEKEINNELL